MIKSALIKLNPILFPNRLAKTVVWLVLIEISLPTGWGSGCAGPEHGAAAQSTVLHIPYLPRYSEIYLRNSPVSS